MISMSSCKLKEQSLPQDCPAQLLLSPVALDGTPLNQCESVGWLS